MDKKPIKFKLPAWLNLTLIIAEIALTVFLVTVSIIAMVTIGSSVSPFIKWLQLNPIWFFVTIVFPLIVLFLLNVYLLIKAVNSQKDKGLNTSGMSKEQLLEEAKRQAREELEAELKNAAVAPEKKDK